MSNETSELDFRSPLLMNRHDTAVLVIDVQEKLAPHIARSEPVIWNISRLLRGAQILGVEYLVTEQYPQGLGSTVEPIGKLLKGRRTEKSMFSCRECSGILNQLRDSGVVNVLLAGIETHVCVAQTALDLLSSGWNVFLAVDATGSRFPVDRDVAIRRMENAGVTTTTTEAILFEWCEVSGTPEFKSISGLVRETAPN